MCQPQREVGQESQETSSFTSGHIFAPTSEAAFGKRGILRLRFRKTGWHIAALTLEQMCCLFYLKRVPD